MLALAAVGGQPADRASSRASRDSSSARGKSPQLQAEPGRDGDDPRQQVVDAVLLPEATRLGEDVERLGVAPARGQRVARQLGRRGIGNG
jgi:hypothetical protein